MSLEQDQPAKPTTTAPLHYAVPSKFESRLGRGFLAVCGTLPFPGLGHWIAGAHRRAIAWCAECVAANLLILLGTCFARLQLAAMLLVPLQFLVFLWMLIDAFLIARRSHYPMLGLPWRRYAAGILLLVLFPFMQAALGKALRAAALPRAEAFTAASSAMSPALMKGDRFLSIKNFDVKRWQVVAVYLRSDHNSSHLDRVVGLPGETVELVAGKVTINGVPITQPGSWGPYQCTLRGRIGNGCTGNPIKLGWDEYFVLGDNSVNAGDARYWREEQGHQPGAIPRNCIAGKATYVYWPPQRWRKFP